MQRLCFFQVNIEPDSFVIFAVVKWMRNISPVLSVVLMMLMLSGTLGYTLVRHSCLHCGTETVTATMAGSSEETSCCCSHHDTDTDHRHGFTEMLIPDDCCIHQDADVNHRHGTPEMLISDDCCSHETERVVTDELVRSELENEIIPWFMLASVVAVMDDKPADNIRSSYADRPFNHVRDLTTVNCQIRS